MCVFIFTGQKLEDGKSLSGKGRLTHERIDKFQVFYGSAIRKNKGDVASMSQATKAILWHNTNFPPEERHQFCPTGESSWCKYQNDIAQNGVSTYVPKQKGLDIAVHDACLPTFKFLWSTDFLEGCKNCLTQNQNESLHHVVWSVVPKEQYHSANEVTVGINIGILMFNTGLQNTVQTILSTLNIKVSNRGLNILHRVDGDRIYRSQLQASTSEKLLRKKRRCNKYIKQDLYLKEEGLTYAAGLASNIPRKSPCCQMCGEPRKGHKRNMCSVKINEPSLSDSDTVVSQ